MNKTLPLKKIVDHPYFGLVCFVAVCFVLPRYGLAATMLGCALVLTACVSGNSARFRSRSGSLTAAAFLVVVMWLATAILAWLTKMGCLTE
ncbi:MAG: hypothetical protein WBE58_15155 [Verrucomicrobiales bacterium]|nr:hypothetical protein [Verrucomicrobiales bacterium]